MEQTCRTTVEIHVSGYINESPEERVLVMVDGKVEVESSHDTSPEVLERGMQQLVSRWLAGRK